MPTKEWPMKQKKGLAQVQAIDDSKEESKKGPSESKQLHYPSNAIQQSTSSSSSENLFILKPMLCLAKCTPNGNPIFPLQVGGLAPDNAAPSEATTPPAHMQQQGAQLANWAFKLPKIVHQT
jgi:hypothetical protein